MNLRLSRRTLQTTHLLLLLALVSVASCERVDRQAPSSKPPEVFTTAQGVEIVLIPAGQFTMGSDHGEADQAPAREVTLDAFLMDRYEITQEVYAKAEPVNGSHFKGPQRPTEMISWGNAALYCNMRSRDEGLEPCYDEDTGECNFEANGYRLPTEAEWEYACRAGTQTDYSFGPDARRLKDHGWYVANAGKKTQPVGKKKPNAWGLYDMHGNVVEWCNDAYDKDYYKSGPAENPRGPAEGERYVLRGGSWTSSDKACSSAVRASEEPGFSDACFARDAIGFRCVRRPPQNAPSDEANPAPTAAQ